MNTLNEILNELELAAHKVTGSDRRERMDPCAVATWQAQVHHVNWMIAELRTWPEDRADKAIRWVCFVQGVLWSLGELTIRQAKLQNFRLLNEGRYP